MCVYHIGENVILVEAYQTKHERNPLPAYNKIIKQLKQAGMQVKMQVLDNKVSADYTKPMTETCKNKYQLVPPELHHRNATEQDTRTMKAHFLAILAGIDPEFPKIVIGVYSYHKQN